MKVRHSILGEGILIEESSIDLGGYNYKVRFNNGLTRWCSKSELKSESEES